MSDLQQPQVLFVEDDDALREAIVQGLELEGMRVLAFGNAIDALRKLDADFAGAIVSDIRLPRMDGLEFFEQIKLLDQEISVIFTTGHGDVAMAVEAMKDGASDFLTKPYSSAELFASIRRAIEKRSLVIENRKLRSELSNLTKSRASGPRVLGSSQQAERLSRMIAEVAAADIDLMIAGEVGTGKNFVARQIHDLGPRQSRPFITIDAAIAAHKDAELLVFGREPGSGLSRSGLIEKANGGTLFLDEVHTLPDAMQARLMSVTENRTILPIGADRPRPVNIRVISASSQTAEAGVQSTPLFHRLSGILITLPNLEQRREDIAEIFRHFATEYERDLGLEAAPISEAEWHYLANHKWHGNLRELRAFARNFVLGLSYFSQIAPDSNADTSLKAMTERFESAVLKDALERSKGQASEVARTLQIQRKTLYDKLTKYGLKPSEFRRR